MKTPIHLWIVGVLALIWNAGGAFDYVMTKTQNEGYLAQLSEAQRSFLETAPLWFNTAWAVGVWLSLLGAILLLIKSRHAATAFLLSLAGLIVATIYTYGIANQGDALAVSGTAALVFTIAIPVILILLWVYARWMTAKGVLR